MKTFQEKFDAVYDYYVNIELELRDVFTLTACTKDTTKDYTGVTYKEAVEKAYEDIK